MRGAHGDRFSVRGEPGGVYNLLSLPNVSFNTEFVSSVFKSPFSRLRVNGSFARHAYWKLRTPQTGKMLRAKPVSIGNASATRLATVPPVSLSRDTKDSAPAPRPPFPPLPFSLERPGCTRQGRGLRGSKSARKVMPGSSPRYLKYHAGDYTHPELSGDFGLHYMRENEPFSLEGITIWLNKKFMTVSLPPHISLAVVTGRLLPAS